mgnify:CR=1 FL=1
MEGADVTFFSRIERFIERAIEGLFRAMHRGPVQPVEIAHKILRVLEDDKRISVFRIYVPNEYVVSLSQGDMARISVLRRTLGEELSEHVLRHVEREGYYLVGPVRVHFIESPSLQDGEVRVEGSFVEEVAEAAGDAEPTIVAKSTAGAKRECMGENSCKAEFVVEGGRHSGWRFPLGGERVVIGRAGAGDLVIDDPHVSREHAEVIFEEGAYALADLGSTNGTYINGRRVSGKQPLRDGDVVRVGETCLRFRMLQ